MARWAGDGGRSSSTAVTAVEAGRRGRRRDWSSVAGRGDRRRPPAAAGSEDEQATATSSIAAPDQGPPPSVHGASYRRASAPADRGTAMTATGRGPILSGDAPPVAARPGPPRAGGQDGRLRRLGDAAVVPDRHPGRAPHLPHRRGRVRRQPPRHGAGGGRRRLRPPPAHPHQRPRPHRPGAGPVHPPARRGRRVGARRRHRVVGRSDGRVPRDAQRVEHRAGGGGRRRRRRHRRPGRSSPSRARRPGGGWPTWPPRRPTSPASTCAASPGRASPPARPAPATPARTASSGRPGGGRARLLGGPARRRPPPRRAGRPRHPPPGGRACPCTATSWAPASRPCRPTWDGSWPGTRATSGAGRRWRRSGPGASTACSPGVEVEGRQPPRAGYTVPAATGSWARSPAATSRPRSAGASPSPSSAPTSAPATR